MTTLEALRLACEVADEWAGEYGFGAPERAEAVLRAVYELPHPARRSSPGVLDVRNLVAAVIAGGVITARDHRPADCERGGDVWLSHEHICIDREAVR